MSSHHQVRFVPVVASPLARPSHQRRRAPFSASYSATCRLLDRELTMLGAKQVIIQLDCDDSQIRRDGMPRSDARMRSPLVILSFESKVGPLSYPADAFTKWEDNLRAIALALEALRLVDRYGVTRNAEQYRGWKAITYRGDDRFPTPEAAAAFLSRLDPVTAAGIHEHDLMRSAEKVREAYSAGAKVYHPDAGGNAESFSQLTAAVEILRGYHERRLR